MSPRTGRPITGEAKKDIKLQVRVDKPTLDCIDECAKKLNTTRSDIVRKGVLLVKGQIKE